MPAYPGARWPGLTVGLGPLQKLVNLFEHRLTACVERLKDMREFAAVDNKIRFALLLETLQIGEQDCRRRSLREFTELMAHHIERFKRTGDVKIDAPDFSSRAQQTRRLPKILHS